MNDKHTILLVDDEPNILKSLQRLMLGTGYEVLMAESGEAALEILAHNHIHLVISDYRMQGMNGVEFLARVKEEYPETIRLILSGFAVVADEVRKLAERTTTATKEIASMIKGIQSETGNAVGSMEKGTKEVEDGKLLADKAGDALREILDGNQRLTDMIQQIATAATEQSSAAEEISKNVEQVSVTAKESATGNLQAAKAAEDLSGQAEELNRIVSQFKVN